jgi:uncharacterized protein
MASKARRATTSRRGDPPAGVILTHGSGASSDHHGLVALDDALSALGLPVRRIDFPYRLAGRRAPDRPPVLIETIIDAAASFAGELGIGTDQLLLGGRSMGGRMCSMAVAEGLPAAGLVLVSYPLHPPGRPERARTEHLRAITVPSLFVSGDRDQFGSPDELRAATRLLAGPTTLEFVAGSDHGLRAKDDEVVRIVTAWVGTRLGS